jgi:beta-N-acetylhexosaminidase
VLNNPNMPPCAPLMLGLAGPELTAREAALFAQLRPLSFILFARNIISPTQTRDLIESLIPLCGGPLPLIAIDQEGGRVQRLRNFGALPPVAGFGVWYAQAPQQALEYAQLYGQLLAAELANVGATWALAPSLDLAWPHTHAVIGSRAFSSNPQHVAALAAAYAQGLHAGGVFSCLKHAPGHGRAEADTHTELPTVNTPLAELETTDFAPFKTLSLAADFMMTAHIVYPALEAAVPATNSPLFLEKIARQSWGFQGLIVADDMGMAALHGPYVQRITTALGAGCDVAICSFSQLVHGMAGARHHSAHFVEVEAAAASIPSLNPRAQAYLAQLKLPASPTGFDAPAARARLRSAWLSSPAQAAYAWPE